MGLAGDHLFWRDTGSLGSPAVVCLHGQFLDGGCFDGLAERQSDSWRVLVPDLPGYGQSPLPSPYSLEWVREVLERDLTACGIREVSVVGYSLGCYHALALALAGVVRVSRLALLGPLAGADPEVRNAFAGYAKAIDDGADLVDLCMSLAAPAGWAADHPAEVTSTRYRMQQAPTATLAEECRAIGRMVDLRPRLHEIRVPVLVRVGDLERNTPVAWGEAIARSIPGATLQVVPGVGHLYLAQGAEETVAAVGRHLASADGLAC